ncbi:MAG: hypothetical protein K2H92_02660 [Bacteroidaceae bacterium]|nr:hypothetical protein [Bacteroidaceae bacterium]
MNEPKINITVMPGAQMNGYVKEQHNYFGTVQRITDAEEKREGFDKVEESPANPDGQQQDIVNQLKPIFFGIEEDAREFLTRIQGMKPKQITDLVNQLVENKKISEVSCHRALWTVLHNHGIYMPTESNWNMQVK